MGKAPPDSRWLRAVVFDMDGLMFDTETLYHQAGHELLRRRNLIFTDEMYLRMMGVPGMRSMAMLAEEYGLPESPEALYGESQAIFRSLLDDGLRLMPGLLGLLERLEAIGLPKAIATSTRRDTADLMLGRYDFHQRFDPIVTSDLVTHGKPDPEIYLLACERLGVEPEHALVLEDSYNGVLSAKAAGCHCIAAPHELSRVFDFSAADLIIDSLSDRRLYAYAQI